MKKSIIIIAILVAALTFILSGCGGGGDSLEGKNIVTFEINGGTLDYGTSSTNQKINFGQLAKISGYNYDYFRHIFKQRFGISPQDYLIEVRLENAKRLLKGTKLTCTEIAYNCGFSSSAQMSLLFKRKFGVSPLAYKKAD